MTFADKLVPSRQKRLLAIDGGGVRALLALETLARIEAVLRERLGRDDTFRLAEFFDFLGGTSSGAILATCLSLGMPVDQVREVCLASTRAMFVKAKLRRRFWYKYDDTNIATGLRETFREYLTDEDRAAGRGDITLGSTALRTLLLVMMRNATTDAPWPLSNNPYAMFNDRARPDCNLDVPLWQLVRASTAAPTYFPPEEVRLGDHRFLFVDGGITPYNNPALMLFLMATGAPYRLQWPTGPDRLLVVSVGTGRARHRRPDLRASDLNLWYNAGAIPMALADAAEYQQDLLCRMLGRCRKGGPLDLEVGTLIDGADGGDVEGGAGGSVPRRALEPLFTYLRYDADLTETGLAELGLDQIRPDDIQKLDSIEGVDGLRAVGQAAARQIEPADFADFVPSVVHSGGTVAN
jgi:predicted acylesterase/phospholipase RssA